MPKWFTLKEADAEFLTSAPFIYRYTATLPASADEVWAELSGDKPLSWCKLVVDAKYTTPRPFGVGTERELTMVPVIGKVREHYFQWEEFPGQRYENAFYVKESTLPGINRFAESTVVEQTAAGTQFTWTFAIEPLGPLKPGLKVGNAVLDKAFGSLMKDTERHFARG
jgi:hypothetical protein